MAELTISPDEIQSAIENYVASFSARTSREEVGLVSYAGDGIAHVEGLPSAMANELLEFPGGVLGVALNLDVREIGAVILGNFEAIEEGQEVRRTGRVLSAPVGITASPSAAGRCPAAAPHSRLRAWAPASI
jgi:F-type H+/Na+-transporting ATPase subunit alpha